MSPISTTVLEQESVLVAPECHLVIPSRLLDLILTRARHLVAADAGSLYLVEKNVQHQRMLRFTLAQNDSVCALAGKYPAAQLPEAMRGQWPRKVPLL